ncbi:MAG: hypothetical protein ACOCPY_03645, partial [Halorubrum sp.]
MAGTVDGRGRRALGALALLAVPTVLAALPLVSLAALLGPGGLGVVPLGAPGGLLAAVVFGPLASALLGPVLVERRIARLPDADLDDRRAAFVADRVEALAADVGADVPEITAVRADAANVAVADGYRGSRIVVSTRLLALPKADRDAALRHALVRLRTRQA